MTLFKRIVKFKCGKYGIRKWTLSGYRYKDLSNHGSYWWDINSPDIDDCKAPFENIIRRTDKGKPISKKELRNQRLIHALKGETQ